MPAWQTLTTADLLNAGHKDIVEAASRRATALGQPDPVPALITAVVNEVRSCIGFRNANQVDSTAGTIAPNLANLCVLKIVRSLKKRLQIKLTDDEGIDEKTYQTRLNQLKEGEWPVDAPVTPVAPTTQDGPPTGYFGSAHKLWGTD